MSRRARITVLFNHVMLKKHQRRNSRRKLQFSEPRFTVGKKASHVFHLISKPNPDKYGVNSGPIMRFQIYIK